MNSRMYVVVCICIFVCMHVFMYVGLCIILKIVVGSTDIISKVMLKLCTDCRIIACVCIVT